MSEPKPTWTYSNEPKLRDEPIHHESRVVAFTDLYVGKRRISVTAREGATDVMVTDTVRYLLTGLNAIYAAYAERDAKPVEDDKDEPF